MVVLEVGKLKQENGKFEASLCLDGRARIIKLNLQIYKIQSIKREVHVGILS